LQVGAEGNNQNEKINIFVLFALAEHIIITFAASSLRYLILPVMGGKGICLLLFNKAR
jgi:hypothetical protein